jgi:hypothetical protein
MGSFRKAKSSGTAKGPSSEHSRHETDLYEVLHHFSEALAIVQTVARALHAAENDLQCPTIGAEIATLRQGVTALQAVHEGFDLAIPGVSP